MATETEGKTYLLGRMAEAEAERFESRLLEDDDAFRVVKEAENDLFDAFAREQLTADERAQFLKRFGGQADRIEFARLLARRVRPDAKSSGTAVRWSAWMPLAAAALLVLVVGLAWLAPSRRGLVQTPGSTVATAPAAVPPVVVTFALARTRAAGDAAIAIPAGSSPVQLRVRLNPADKYDRYAFELRSSSDRVIWRADDLRGTADAGDLIVTATVPATVEAGTYELAVRGGADELGFMPVRIMRTP